MTYKICVACGSLEFYHHEEYVICGACGTLRTIYSYDISQYSDDYAKTYLGYSLTETNLPLNLYRLGLVARFLKGKASILDIGCCIGEFVKFAEPHYNCVGFEPNLSAANIAQHRCSSPIITALNGQFPKFNAITLFDVIEHLEDPVGLLSFLRDNYLEDDGVLVISTPNISAVSLDPAGVTPEKLSKWKHYKPKEHLFLFSALAMQQALAKKGFSMIHADTIESDLRPGNPNSDLFTMVGKRVKPLKEKRQ